MIKYHYSFKTLEEAEQYLNTLSGKDKFNISEVRNPDRKKSIYFLVPVTIGKGSSFAHSGDEGYKYFIGFNYLNDPDVKDLGIGFRFRFKAFCMIFVTRKDWFGLPKITFYNYYKA